MQKLSQVWASYKKPIILLGAVVGGLFLAKKLFGRRLPNYNKK